MFYIYVFVYCPPKHNKNFISEFSDFITRIKYDSLLTSGDFNIYVGSPSNQDFINFIDSFNVTQWISGPTHQQGYILDLVLSHGLPVVNIVIHDACFSDRNPVAFDVAISRNPVKPYVSAHLSHAFTPLTAEKKNSPLNMLLSILFWKIPPPP